LKEGIIRGQFPFYEGYEFLLTEFEADVIIIENFRLYPGKSNAMIGNDFKTSQVIGIMKYIANDYRIPVVLQSASQAKNAFTLEKLKQLGVSTSRADKVRHSQDAIRHLFYFIQFNCRKPKTKKSLELYAKEEHEFIF
jgi:hypothetical protein